jgi:dsRNA-specific ribonuclease
MIGTQVEPVKVAVAQHSSVSAQSLTSQPRIGTGQQLVSSIGSNPNLARVARQIGLDGGIVSVRPGHMGPPTQSMLATTVEAVLGAIYWDSRDEQNVRRAMIRIGLIT